MGEFWDDTLAAGSAHSPDYFIGSVVLFTSSRDTLDIVDGQQRLTTIILLLAAIRDAFTKHGFDSLAEGTHTSYIERTDRDNVPRYVLQTEAGYPFLHDYVQSFTPGALRALPDVVAGGEVRLHDALKYLLSKVADSIDEKVAESELPTESADTLILDHLKFLRDRLLALKLIQVLVDKEDDAYIIFETLNTRGKELSIIDLVRNFLFRDLRPINPVLDKTRDKWESILETLNTVDPPIDGRDFITHTWLSRHDYVSQKETFRDMKKVIVGKEAKAQLLTHLSEDVPLYRDLRVPRAARARDPKLWKREREPLLLSLRAMTVFRVTQPLPFLLAVLRSYVEQGLPLAVGKRAFRAVEEFHYKSTAISGISSSGGITRMYANHARDVSRATTRVRAVHAVNALVEKLEDRVPPKDLFLAGFQTLTYSTADPKNLQLIRYSLGEIYRTLSGGAVVPDFDAMTLEHVAPQRPPKQTPLANYAAIGNIILVSQELNNELSNKSFSEKRERLRAAGDLWLDDVLARAEDWDQDSVDERTAFLAEAAYSRVWPLGTKLAETEAD